MIIKVFSKTQFERPHKLGSSGTPRDFGLISRKLTEIVKKALRIKVSVC